MLNIWIKNILSNYPYNYQINCHSPWTVVAVNAIRPETFMYRKLIQPIGKIKGISRPTISVPPSLVYIARTIISLVVNDVLITREEIEGLMPNLLCINSPPTGKMRLTGWIEEHTESLGKQYTSELARRIDRETEYKSN